MCRIPGLLIIGDTPAPAYCAGSMARFAPVAAAAWAEPLCAIPSVQGGAERTTIPSRGFFVKVIARIPALDEVVATTRFDVEVPPASTPSPAPAVTRSRGSTRPRRGNCRSGFPVGSIVVLTLLATFAWSLASWNESRRIERARAERIARVQGVTANPGTIPR